MKVKLKSNNEIFDAFICGDSRPDWFCDYVTDNSVITFHNSEYIHYVIKANGVSPIPIQCFKGDYIINTKFGLTRANPDAFRKLYDIIEEDKDEKEPVYTININDLFSYQKEKERADALERQLNTLTEYFNKEIDKHNDFNNKLHSVNKQLSNKNTELTQQLKNANSAWVECTGTNYPASAKILINGLQDKCSRYEKKFKALDESREYQDVISLQNKIKELESRLKKEIELRDRNLQQSLDQLREQRTFNEHIVAENEEFCQKIEAISKIINN